MNARNLTALRAGELLSELTFNQDVECDYDGKRQPFLPLLTRFVLENMADRDMSAILALAARNDAWACLSGLEREMRIAAESIAEGELPDPYQREVARRKNVELEHRDARYLADREEV